VRFLIAGAGAVGGYIGARLWDAGEDVTLLARGAHLQAIRQNGLRILSSDADLLVHPRIIDTPGDAGSVDVIFLSVKTHGLSQLAPQLTPLIGPHTTVVSTQNGLPWWYFHSYTGQPSDLRLERVDPGGTISQSIDPRRVLGAIIYFSTELVQPGVIRHIEGNRISLGEPDGSPSDRSRQIAGELKKAGLRCSLTTHIRKEIWVKLLGSIAFNPISALTGATLVQIARDPDVSILIQQIMTEVAEVVAKLKIELPVSIDQRIRGAEKVGEHKTSMLQDLEAGRPMELDAVVGAALEIGEELGVSMPHTRTVYACTKLLERTATKAAFVPTEARDR
jgi:2-dehydropantoate 2-reductase